MSEPIHLIFYADGSCRGNPGFGGYGVYGYSYKPSERPKNTNHPAYSAVAFTSEGLVKKTAGIDKTKTAIEVLDIYEMVVGLGNAATNNEGELLAVVHALTKTKSLTGIKSVTIYTDSTYVVKSTKEYLHKWAKNGWRKATDNQPISNMIGWQTLHALKTELEELGIEVSLVWVKGHADNVGNNIADLYAVIGSNAAKQHPTEKPYIVYETTSSHKDYKESFPDKDLIYQYKDLYFNASKPEDCGDDAFCFVTSSDDIEITGKRNTSSMYSIHDGVIPSLVNKLRAYYRSIPREYETAATIRVNKLTDKTLLRLLDKVEIRYMLEQGRKAMDRLLIGDTTPLLCECTVSFPFIRDSMRMLDAINLVKGLTHKETPEHNGLFTNKDSLTRYDITSLLMTEGKLTLTNKSNLLDIEPVTGLLPRLIQKPVLILGGDIPTYLMLKSVEEEIQLVELYIDCGPDDNYANFYVCITLKDRKVWTVNVGNKYVSRKLNMSYTVPE